MKHIRTTIALFTAVITLSSLAQSADPSTITAYVGTGKKCHVEGCKRLPTDPTELAKMKKVTLADALAMGRPPCSRCPVSEDLKTAGAAPSGKAPAASSAAASIDPATIAAYVGASKKCHVEGCPRLTKDPAELALLKKMTLAEAMAMGRPPCSKCPVDVSALATAAPVYDSNMTVYCDALWMRVHAPDCPELILKENKKTMTLEQADKEGWRIGESGQSGREQCCLQGYQRKYPKKEIPEDSLGIAQVMKKGPLKWHLAGCHRFLPVRDYARVTLKEATPPDYRICEHCIERGPSLSTISDEGWAQLPSSHSWEPPAGWSPQPFSPDRLPPSKDAEILIDQALAQPNGIQESQFNDPVATVENFMTMRFFFPVENWLEFYKVYRATGDKRLLDKLLESARHYNQLSTDYLSATQKKAGDPEGMPFMYSMAASARITLQLAKKHPDQVSTNDIAEAETFLKTIISVLKPTCEGDENLDPNMGIPQALADDFRTRAFNRAMNGIGTISMTAAALGDLQELRQTKEYQPQIARYRKIIQEYITHWKSIACLYTEKDGKKYFYYPYGADDKGKLVDGFKLYRGPEDQGHYSHTVQGLMCIYESTPELGIDDDFMTAVANAVYHNSKTQNGSIQCPSADKARPFSRKPFGAPSERFYMLNAFNDGVIDGQCSKLSTARAKAANSEYSRRLATLHSQYMKALRNDRSLIYLGDKK